MINKRAIMCRGLTIFHQIIILRVQYILQDINLIIQPVMRQVNGLKLLLIISTYILQMYTNIYQLLI